MEFTASNNFARVSPQKMRLVINAVRGRGAEEAQQQLQFLPHRAAKICLTLLNSAIANAENNFGADRTNLYIATVMADAGPVIKRYMPRAMGRIAPLRSRTSKVKLVLAERDPKKGRSEVAKKAAPEAIQLGELAKAQTATKADEKGSDTKATKAAPVATKAAPEPKNTKGFGQRIFRRKDAS